MGRAKNRLSNLRSAIINDDVTEAKRILRPTPFKLINSLFAPNVNARFSDGRTSLHFACNSGNLEMVALLVGFGADVNAATEDGETPLLTALSGNYDSTKVEIAFLLIQNGACVNISNNSGCTPLIMAMSVNEWTEYNVGETKAIVSLLLSEGADPNVGGGTPLIAGVSGRGGWCSEVEADLKELFSALIVRGADVNAKSYHGYSVLHHALQARNSPVAIWLVAKGAKVNSRANDGSTPLYWALEEREEEAADQLVALGAVLEVPTGAELNPTKRDDRRLLHWAAECGRRDFIETLLASGANANASEESGATPLHYATSAEAVDALVVGGAIVDSVTKRGWTPLIRACDGRPLEVTKRLLASGADINFTCNYGTSPPTKNLYAEVPGIRRKVDTRVGYTPLHMAVSAGQVEVVELLLANGANVEATNDDGITPLWLAVCDSDFAIATLLVAQGANVNCSGTCGRTPMDLAVEMGSDKCADLLKGAGASVNAKKDLDSN